MGGSTSVVHNGDRVTTRYQEGPVTITITGRLGAGRYHVEEIVIFSGGRPTRYPSLDKVPAAYHDKVGLLMELGDDGDSQARVPALVPERDGEALAPAR
jgi:hypothetical protein